jgi:hypothetical protein
MLNVARGVRVVVGVFILGRLAREPTVVREWDWVMLGCASKIGEKGMFTFKGAACVVWVYWDIAVSDIRGDDTV